jgi:glucose-1-phosphate cytidylyltransferase
MKVVILCGGKGIRSFPFTNYLPKPMMPLAGTPLIVHVIRSFVTQGFHDFVLAAGYRKSVLDDYFEGRDLNARIEVVDTGEDSNTGERIFDCRHLLGDRFIVSYADALCDVPLRRLVAFHESHGGAVTITSVPMTSQYGVLTVSENGQVTRMREKPIVEDHWINAGFMVFDSTAFAHWVGSDLEREVLPELIRLGMVWTYRHRGFFKSAENYKDIMEFEELMSAGGKPWEVREPPA